MILPKEKIYQGPLLLVNEKYPIKEMPSENIAYGNGRRDNMKKREVFLNLIPVDDWHPDILMKREAANILQMILKKINAGTHIVPVSGYRSVKEQTDIYKDSLKDNGEEFTKKFVAMPNHSEHQTGFAIDLGLNEGDIDFICPDFPYEGICNKFRSMAPDYGFIQRYEKDKEKITGISHEPWHFRYVGYPHSKIMEEKGISLEEYTELIKSYREDNPLAYKKDNSPEVEIYYAPSEGDSTLIVLPKSCIYQISGNNVDGFIITIWKSRDKICERMQQAL